MDHHSFGRDEHGRPSDQVAALETELHSLQTQIAHALEAKENARGISSQLKSALARREEVESLGPALMDARASLAHLEDVNAQLHQELHRSRMQLRDARQVALDAEDRLLQLEDELTQTRERLFSQHSTAAQLEDELKKHSDLHGDLHSQLEAKKSKHMEHELALRRARHTVGVMKGEKGYGNPFGGNSAEGDEAPLQRLAHETRRNSVERSNQTGATASTHLVLRRTAQQVWSQTPHAAPTSGPAVLRTPPGSSEWLERAEANFRNLLVQRKGTLYRDDQVSIDMSTFGPPLGGTHRPVFNFELTITNRGGHSVHDVKLTAQQGGRGNACELRVQPQSAEDAAGMLSRRPLKFWGELEITDAFETWPQVAFSYLLADNMSCMAMIRLPLAVTRLLSPAKLDKQRFLQLWESSELAHHEVAFICTVREELLSIGVSFSFAKCLEFGGCLQCLPGLDESPGSAVLAGLWPMGRDDGEPVEVLWWRLRQAPRSKVLHPLHEPLHVGAHVSLASPRQTC